MSTHHLPVGSPGTSPSRGQMDHSLSWTDDLPVCHQSGVGFSTNQIYREDGFRKEEHEFEDRSIHFSVEDNISLYGVFDGHDGSRVSNFAAQRMPAELLLGQLSDKTEEAQIRDILQQAFIAVEKGFVDSIDDLLAEKLDLMLHVPDGVKQYELYNKYPELFKRLESVEAEISGGTTAVVALIKDNKLYIANVGFSRALLCTTESDGVLRVVQLSVDHSVSNEAELMRLANLGTDVETLVKIGKIGTHNSYTRSIGDHDLKTRIREMECFSNVTGDPVIAEPHVTEGLLLNESCRFLILMSYGLYKSLEDALGTEHVNREIASMVATEFGIQSTLNGVAQAVVDKIVRLHHDTFMTNTGHRKAQCQKRKDITLLVRNFNYPLPNAISSPTVGCNINPLVTSLAEQRRRFIDNLNEPLSVIIPPPESKSSPPNSRPMFPFLTNSSVTNTNSHTHTNANTNLSNLTSTYTNSNESNLSGDEAPFQRSARLAENIELDADGRVGAYVDFSDFYKAIEEMTEAQRESFSATSEPKPAYETIPEEPMSPGTAFLHDESSA